jgi:hypothetical protein
MVRFSQSSGAGRNQCAEHMKEISRGVVAGGERSDIRQVGEGHVTIRHDIQGLRNEWAAI